MASKKEQICTLLKGIETGDPRAVDVVDESQYIQHNPLTRTGTEGLAELFQRLSKTNPKVEIVRVFEDGDYVFAHTDYDFNIVEVGFEVFRFEDERVVEHWDNLQLKPNQTNLSGHTMLDGTIEAEDLEKTEENRAFIRSYTEEVLINKRLDKLDHYISSENYTEHAPQRADGRKALQDTLQANLEQAHYNTIHRILAEGSFVLCVSEGSLKDVHISFYDLYRVNQGQIVEHWNTVDEVPPKKQWVNNNGKF